MIFSNRYQLEEAKFAWRVRPRAPGPPTCAGVCAWWGGSPAATGAERSLLHKDVERFGAKRSSRISRGESDHATSHAVSGAEGIPAGEGCRAVWSAATEE